MRRTTRWLLLIVVGGGLLFGTLSLNWLLGRPDRIAAAKARDDLIDVYDQILRYEVDKGKLPPNLGFLVPHYVQQEQLPERYLNGLWHE